MVGMDTAANGKSPAGQDTSKRGKTLPVGKFSVKQGHANEKRFSRRRSSAPWNGGGDGPIALRERGRFRQIRSQIARTGLTQSRAAGFCPNRFQDQHGHPLPMEGEYRDNGLLGRRAGRRQQSGPKLQELLGRELDLELWRL